MLEQSFDKRLIRLISDDEHQTLFKLMQAHLRLSVQYLDRNTTQGEKTSIKRQIERLRVERDQLIKEYQSKYKGDV